MKNKTKLALAFMSLQMLSAAGGVPLTAEQMEKLKEIDEIIKDIPSDQRAETYVKMRNAFRIFSVNDFQAKHAEPYRLLMSKKEQNEAVFITKDGLKYRAILIIGEMNGVLGVTEVGLVPEEFSFIIRTNLLTKSQWNAILGLFHNPT